jgi:acyl-CoA thioesterase FadM
VVEGLNITVCVRADTFKKIEVPEWLRSALTNYERGITESL